MFLFSSNKTAFYETDTNYPNINFSLMLRKFSVAFELIDSLLLIYSTMVPHLQTVRIFEMEHRLTLECVSFSFSLTQKNSFSDYSKTGDEKRGLLKASQTKKTVAKHLITFSILTEIDSAWINISSL